MNLKPGDAERRAQKGNCRAIVFVKGGRKKEKENKVSVTGGCILIIGCCGNNYTFFLVI